MPHSIAWTVSVVELARPSDPSRLQIGGPAPSAWYAERSSQMMQADQVAQSHADVQLADGGSADHRGDDHREADRTER